MLDEEANAPAAEAEPEPQSESEPETAPEPGALPEESESEASEAEPAAGEEQPAAGETPAPPGEPPFLTVVSDGATLALSQRQVEELVLAALGDRRRAEMAELRREFPEAGAYETLPEPVRKMAETGVPLLTAWLLYRHREQRRIAEEEAAAARAAAQTAGSVKGQPDPESPADRAFREAFWGS